MKKKKKQSLDRLPGMWHIINVNMWKGKEGATRGLFSFREKKPAAESFFKFRHFLNFSPEPHF